MDWKKLTKIGRKPRLPERKNQITLEPDKGLLDAFMMTAVGDYLPEDPPLYAAGDIIGLWEIVDVIGSGGMGDVYKARRADGLYDQTVALKVMKGTDPARKKRFNRERQRLAALNHSGIASIIDGGVSSREHSYMAMEYVEGRSIYEYCQAQNLQHGSTLKLFGDMCAAVAYAHNNLILHRDLKSDNILVTDHGQIKLIDFGIATLLDDEDETQSPFSLQGAAPEQLNGESLSAQTDIFALGILLHRLLTDSFPVRQPEGGVKPKLGSLSPDLAAIIGKALNTVPSDRYKSVTAFSDDISAYINFQPVKAYTGTGAYRLKKLFRRAPFVSTLTVGLIASLILGIGASQYYAQIARDEAQRANVELETANWLRVKSDLDVAMSDAYADGFRFAFGQDKEDRLSEYLLEYHASVIDKYKSVNPDYAAVTSFVIGEHFIRRDDYVNGRVILDPWIAEEYGSSKRLISLGQAMLGHGYRGLEENEAAANLFAKSASFYIGTPDENSFDHLAPATLAGIMSTDKALEDDAEKRIGAILKTTEDSFTKVFFLSRLSNLEKKRGNWDAVHKALLQCVEIINSNRSGNFAGEDIIRKALIESYIFYKQDYTGALAQMKILEDFSENERGENLVLGDAILMRSAMHWKERDLDAASVDLAKAERLIFRYNGEGKGAEFLRAHTGFMQVDMKDFTSAEAELAALNRLDSDVSDIWANMLELYLIAKRDGVAAAQAFAENNVWDTERAMKTPQYYFYFNTLLAEGLTF